MRADLRTESLRRSDFQAHAYLQILATLSNLAWGLQHDIQQTEWSNIINLHRLLATVWKHACAQKLDAQSDPFLESAHIIMTFLPHVVPLISSMVYYYSMNAGHQCRPDRRQRLVHDNSQGLPMYTLKSPRYGLRSSYPEMQLSYYHVKCEEGTRVHFYVNNFILRGKNRKRKCVDYVVIQDLKDIKTNSKRYCGKDTSFTGITYSNDVLVTFQSGIQTNRNKGFRIFAFCYNSGTHSMENCLKVKEVEYATDKRTKVGLYYYWLIVIFCTGCTKVCTHWTADISPQQRTR